MSRRLNIYNFNALGFTLVELMIVLAIAGIVMTVGIPSFSQSITNSRLTTNINELVTSLNLARSEAVKRNQPVTIRKISTEWESGWSIFTDADGDGVQEAGDTLLKTYGAMPDDYTLRGTTPGFTNRITFKASGLSGNGSFVLCDNSDSNNVPEANTSKLVIVNTVGRVRMGVDVDSNGVPEKADGSEITSCTVSPFA